MEGADAAQYRSAALRGRADLPGRVIHRQLILPAGPGFGRRADQFQPYCHSSWRVGHIWRECHLPRPPDDLLYPDRGRPVHQEPSDPHPAGCGLRTDPGGLPGGLRAAGHHAGAEWRVQPLQRRRAGTRRRSEILPDPRCATSAATLRRGRAAARAAGSRREAAPDPGRRAVRRGRCRHPIRARGPGRGTRRAR